MNNEMQTADVAATTAEAPKLVITVRQLDKLETTSVRQGDGPY